MKKTLSLATLIFTLVGVLVACGGGGGSSSGSSSSSLSGTVASGSPLVSGTLNLVDANGRTSSTPIASDGSYSISTAGLTPPFVLQASGYVGGNLVTMYSAAASASQTANVTPLTQGVAMLALNNSPELVFNGTISMPSASALTTGLQTANTTLQSAVSSAMTAVGATVTDFIQSRFTADHTGVDLALDYLQIDNTFQNSGGTQVPAINISNRTASAGNTSGFVSATTSAVTGSLGPANTFNTFNISTIPVLLAKISAKISASDFVLADWNSVNIFDSSFLDGGRTPTTFLSYISAGSAGNTISSAFVPLRCRTINTNDAVCNIKATMLSSTGNPLAGFEISMIQRGSTGDWKLFGNQAHVNYQVQSYVQKTIRLDGVTLTPAQTYTSGIHFDIEQPAPRTAILSAQFFVVRNGAEQGSPVIQLKQQAGCTYFGLVDSFGNPTCNNMQAIDGSNNGTILNGAATLANINNTFQSGGTFFRLKTYSDNNFTTLVDTIDFITLNGGIPPPALAGSQMTFGTLTSASIATLNGYTSSVGTRFNLAANSNVAVNGMHVIVNGTGGNVDDNGGSANVQLSSNSYQINLMSIPPGVTATSARALYLLTQGPLFLGTKYVGCNGGTCW